MRLKSKQKQQEQAFTLLEVILALVILTGALGTLTQIMRLGHQSAERAASQSMAQMLAASVLAELESGIIETIEPVSQAPFDLQADPPWVYSVAVASTEYDQIVRVSVLVSQQVESNERPAKFELVRLLPNPDYVPPEEEEE